MSATKASSISTTSISNRIPFPHISVPVETMPKAIRPSTSEGKYRITPSAIATPSPRLQYQAPVNSSHYYPNLMPNIATNNNMHSSPVYQPLHAFANGGPVQIPQSQMQSRIVSQGSTMANDLYQQHISHPLQQRASPPVPSLPARLSSGAWTPHDDATLMTARAAGQNWAPIQAMYFPNKTPNACRKRHERLVDRRNSDDWDTVKLELMAKRYIDLRREMWEILAEGTGDKWSVLEQKCMSIGLKNLQQQARAFGRRGRNYLNGVEQKQIIGVGQPQATHSMDNSAYNDDSGLGSDDVDMEAETEYGTGANEYGIVQQTYVGGHSGAGVARLQQQQRQIQQQQQQRQRQQDDDGLKDFGRSYGAQSLMGEQQGGQSIGMQGAYGMQGRVANSDSMGIPSIINRPNGGK